MGPLRATIGFLFTAIAVVAALALGLISVERLDRRPRTDDAVLQADIVRIAAEVSGRITALPVRENQLVRAGDVLFVIDPEPYRYRVEQARASVGQIEASLDEMGRQIASQGARAEAAASGILSAETALAQSVASLARMQPLLVRGYVSAKQVDQARTAVRSAEIGLTQSRQQALAAREGITSTRSTEQQLAGARAQLASAERDLRQTTVRAPCDGRVTGLNVAAGEYVTTGGTVFTLIDTQAWYATGNFREIDLDGIEVGDRAIVYVLSQPRTPLRGVIDGLNYGVQPEGGTGSGLPRVARSLNWVRIAQRFPVRVRLTDPPAPLMRIGASAVVIIERTRR